MRLNPFKRTKALKVEEDVAIEVPKNSGQTLGKIHEKFNKYPVLCIIFSKRGKSWKLLFDWAVMFKKEGVDYYRLKKRKATFKPPQYSSVVTAMNGQDVLVLQNLTRDEYYPMEVSTDINWLKFAEDQQAIRNFLINEVTRIRTKGQSFILQHLPLITMIVMFMMFVVGAWVFWDAMGDLVMQQTASVRIFSGAIDKLSIQQTTPPPAVW